MIIDIELNKLRDEISDLKKCQVDFIKLATILFVAVVSVVGALLPNLKLFENGNINIWFVLIYILLIGIIPIVYPYILWIIIHKCRSIFRIVSYIRAIEYMLKNTKKYEDVHVGYETLHRKLKEYPWLSVRVSTFNNSIQRVFKKFTGYKTSTENANKEWALFFQNNNNLIHLISVDGLDKKETGPYIGDYYGRIIFFVKLMTAIGYIALFPFLYIGIISVIPFFNILIGSILFLLIIWAIYHYKLSRRYLMELRFRPFSMDAYYDMWMWAIRNS